MKEVNKYVERWVIMLAFEYYGSAVFNWSLGDWKAFAKNRRIK